MRGLLRSLLCGCNSDGLANLPEVAGNGRQSTPDFGAQRGPSAPPDMMPPPPPADLAPPPDMAPTTPWFKASNGLWMGQLNAVVADQNNLGTVYVASLEGGVYKSTDSGASWHTINNGLGNPDAWALAIDPNDSKRILVGTAKGVYRSLDAGASWSQVDYGGKNGYVEVIVFDPTLAHVVYLVDQAPGGSLFRSSDGGDHWNDLGSLSSDVPGTLTIDPSDPQHLMMTAGWKLWASHDGGLSWKVLPSQPAKPFDGVLGVAIDPSRHLLCAPTGLGVSVSSDDGASWTQTLSVYTAASVALFPGGQFYAVAGGIYRSLDCVHWLRIYDGYDAYRSPTRDPSGAVYSTLLPTGGILRSPDGQFNWTLVNHGLDNTGVVSLSIDPLSPGHLYVWVFGAPQDSFQLYETNDGAASWQPALLTGAGYAVATDGNEVIAAGFWKIYTSFNKGESWNLASMPENLVGFAFDPHDASRQRVYAAAYQNAMPGTPQAGAYVSNDRGLNWTALSAAKFDSDTVFVDPGHAGRIWLAGTPSASNPVRTLYRSDDAGTTWSAVVLPLTVPLDAFVIASKDGQTLFATIQNTLDQCALVKSSDGGASWALTGQFFQSSNCRTIAAKDATTLYVAADGDETSIVWKSSDGGQSWRSASNGLFGGGGATQLVIDPLATDTLYLATGGNGVFKTITGGE
jgi:photosystem II stability/assembly factor-like uncharacterized protein